MTPQRCRHCKYWTGSKRGSGEDLKRACQNVSYPAFYRQRTGPGFGCSAFDQKQTAANPTPAAAHSTESYPSKSASNGNQEGVRHATR